MKFWSKKSIRAKLLVTVGVAVTAGVLLASVASAVRETDRRFASRQAEIASIGAALAASVAPALVNNDRRRIASTINAIGRIPTIIYARVLNARGMVAYEVGNGIIISRSGEQRTTNQTVGPFTGVHLGTSPWSVDIVEAGVVIGTLELIADLSDLRAALIESLLQSLAFGLIAACIGMIVSYGFQCSITGPIGELTKTMTEVREAHDFSRTVTRRSDDEIGRLVDAFNGMLHDIRARDQQLALHRAGLEDEVRARTAELSAARQAAEAANMAKSQFLATMSHEIRTPMNGVLVMAELLSASALPPRLQRLSDVIVKSGNSLLSIINDILDFSKIEAGKMELESVPLDPAELVDDVLRLFAQRASERGVDLSAYVAPDVPASIAADPVRLNQVLTNLINNALKFTDHGHVSVRQASKTIGDGDSQRVMLTFSVTDTGIGIPAHKLETIFDTFSQADSSTTRSYGGTGIGLSICQRLVEKMGGTLSVTSEAGVGSEFTAQVPVECLVSAASAQIVLDESAKTILVLLPPSPSCDALHKQITDAGFTGICIDPDATGTAALPAADIVFTAAATLPALWKSGTGSIPETVIAITRLGDTPARQAARAVTVAAELQYPFCTGEVRPLLAGLAGGPATLQAYREAANATSQVAPASFAGISVLAADDSAVNREVLVEALSRLDVDVTCVDNGAEAVAAIKERTFDLVFMDGSMPILDGYQATREIREHETAVGRSRMPVVALTAHVIGEHASGWRQAGMDDCVTKPFTLATIEACLTRFLKTPPKQGESPEQDEQGEMAGEQRCDDPATKLLDESVLSDIRAMQSPGKDLLGRVIGIYSSHAPGALGRLSELRCTSQSDAIASAAHALKSLSRNIGAVQVGDLCDRIEAGAVADSSEISDSEIRTLTESLDATIAALNDYQTMNRSEPVAKRRAG